jgi:hypothetical protein
MPRSISPAVKDYLNSLPADRRTQIEKVRNVILENLPKGYQESVSWGMLSYEVPLSTYPDTYNGRPLSYAALASQKNYMSVYLTNISGDDAAETWFRSRYEASGKKLDMGKSCVRFKNVDDLPLEVIGEAIARTPVDEFVRVAEKARAARK